MSVYKLSINGKDEVKFVPCLNKAPNNKNKIVCWGEDIDQYIIVRGTRWG
jgi:hypothetical protein